MENYHALIVLVLRENGIIQIGQVGKEILAHMLVEKINNPNATYEQICEAVNNKNIAKYGDTIKKEDLICCCNGLTGQECSVLYLIESIETHEYHDNGKEVIKAYIEKIYEKVKKRLLHEEIVQNVQRLGLYLNNEGVMLMISMAYKYRIRHKGYDEAYDEVYEELMKEHKPLYVKKKLKEAKGISAEIRQGANISYPNEAEIVKEGINELIMQAAKKSPKLSNLSSVNEVINVILSI